MTVKTFTMKAKENEIIFGRPYLNDQKELAFKDCSAFNGYPSMEFVLCEDIQKIELRHPDSKKKVFLLLKGNERLLKEAIEEKEAIKELLRQFTKNMSNGTEKIIVKLAGIKQYPYYFTTHMMQEHSERSCKFSAGFLYFMNLRLKEANIDMEFDSFDALQERLGEYFRTVGFEKFKPEQIDGEKVYILSFGEFVQLLV